MEIETADGIRVPPAADSAEEPPVSGEIRHAKRVCVFCSCAYFLLILPLDTGTTTRQIQALLCFGRDGRGKARLCLSAGDCYVNIIPQLSLFQQGSRLGLRKEERTCMESARCF